MTSRGGSAGPQRGGKGASQPRRARERRVGAPARTRTKAAFYGVCDRMAGNGGRAEKAVRATRRGSEPFRGPTRELEGEARHDDLSVLRVAMSEARNP